MWVREHEPENWKRVRAIMLPKDYVRFRMTGDRAIDMADASGTLLLDVAQSPLVEAHARGDGAIDERHCCRPCSSRRMCAAR